MAIRAALFDFDGVVVQSEMLHKRTFMEILSPWKISVTNERWYTEFAGTGSKHIFEVLVKENGIVADVDQLVSERKKIYESYVRGGDLHETAGVKAYLAHLRSLGVKTAVVSGSHRTNVELALNVLKLEEFFDVIICGDDIKWRKPDPMPFLFAAQKLNVEPSKCVVFEDSVSGCEAARRAGMKLVVVRSQVSAPVGRYDLMIDDFTEGKTLKKLL